MKIALIGEAWGEFEEKMRTPFIGPTGGLLNKMLAQAGIRRADCFVTNVFNLRPPGNKLAHLCGPKEEGIIGYPSLIPSGYVNARYGRELLRLQGELEEVKPNVIVALGNTASWAVLGKTSIMKIRGVIQPSTKLVKGIKVMPTYHPAFIMRSMELIWYSIMDLRKARNESEYPEVRRPERHIWVEPTIEDIYEFDRLYIHQSERLSVDIETAGEAITCIGFAPSKGIALVVPFYDPREPGRNYWPDSASHRQAYNAIAAILSRPTPAKTFQNGLYDISFLYRALRIKVRGATHDTMLLHHALQPESLKGLGFLGSVYTSESLWKDMRKRKTTIKRED